MAVVIPCLLAILIFILVAFVAWKLLKFAVWIFLFIIILALIVLGVEFLTGVISRFISSL
jgi:hypothetical protein